MRRNLVEHVAIVGPANETATNADVAELLGQCQAAHDVPCADIDRGIYAKIYHRP
jgi:hypothetical protein